MKLTPEEKAAAEEAARWFVGELASFGSEATRNAAFYAATRVAIDQMRTPLRNRLLAAFSGGGKERFQQYAEYTSDLINKLIKNNRQAGLAAGDLPVENPGEATLRNYLYLLESLLDASRGNVRARKDDGSGKAIRSLDGSDLEQGVQLARQLWAVAKNARIFDFRPEDWLKANRAADVYTTTKIAKLDWIAPTAGSTASNPNYNRTPSEEEQAQFIETIREAGSRVPFPDPLPFGATYLGFGAGVALTQDQFLARAALPTRPIMGAALLGYVIWDSEGGWVTEILQVVEPEDNFLLPNVVCMNGIWFDPVLTLAPWITTYLVGVIHDHRKLIIESRPTTKQRRTWQKRRERLKVPALIPKPYYIVRLRKELIEETERRSNSRLSKISRELSYRHDRRGHERCYIRRGKLPLEPKDAKKLTDGGYKIWTLDEPDSNAYRQLMERGQPPKSPDEWIAILTRWIDPTVVGPDDKPYVPAIRMRAFDDRET